MPYRRTRHSSPFMSPPVLIILLPIVVLTLLFFAVPPLLSATTHALRPSSVVKKSWDSLNILLVVFAILCGVFARRSDDESQQQDDAVPDRNAAFRKMRSGEEEGEGGGGYVSQQWFGFSDERKGYDPPPIPVQSPATGVTRLRRNSSSYPDLRNWETGDDRFRFRFFDDFEIDKQFRSPARDQVSATVDLRTRWPVAEEGDAQVKEISVDTFETRSTSPPPEPPPKTPAPPTPPPPPPPPPPPAESRRKPRGTYHKGDSVSEITELDDDREFTRIRSPPLAPPTPSPPAPAKTRSEHKHGRSERRKSSVKRDIATVWASVLSNQRKKKKKPRTKSDHIHHHYDNFIDELTNCSTMPPPSPAPAPPPPPPPPPPSVFHNLFRKGLGKSKKIHSVSAPPPPPPPPPLTSSRRWSKWKSAIPTPPPPPPATDPPEPLPHRKAGRPPLPNRASGYNDEAVNAGNQSPLIPVPPPPPPFKMPAMKFVVRGDFVKIRSNQSSRCSSPERDDIGVSSSTSTVEELETTATVNTVSNAVTDRNGEVGGSVFCPSPDVNVKATTFIARLRGEWKLEKLNSLKEKGNGALPLRGYGL